MFVQDSTAWSGCSNSAEPSATNAPSTVAAIPVRYAAVDVLDPTRLTRLATRRRDDSLAVFGRMVDQSTGVSPLAVTR